MVKCNIKSQKTQSTYNFLLYNDIVKKNWYKNIFDIFGDFFLFFKFYIFSGFLFKQYKIAKINLIAGLYPIFYIFFSYFFNFLIAYFIFLYLNTYINIVFSILMALLFVFFIHFLIFKFGNKIAAFWILRICIFCAKLARNDIKDISKRCENFAEILYQKLKDNQHIQNYELIFISHSVGTILAIEILDILLRKCIKTNLDFNKLKIITLGECIPLVSMHKEAKIYRFKLDFISNFKLFWLDFSSKIDGICYYKIDFFNNKNKAINIHFLSPRFHKLFNERTYKKLRYDWYNIHFLYLMNTELKGDYNFFDFITNDDILENKLSRI